METRSPRQLSLLLFVAALTVLAAGCCTSISFVAIPPEDYRSEKASLPLSQSARSHILAFLKSGGDRGTMPDVVDLTAGRYDSLLAILSDTANLTVEALEGGPRFRTWFPDAAVYGAIDAREESMDLLDRPISYRTDEKYWWVFYRTGGDLTHVLVARDMMREPRKGE